MAGVSYLSGRKKYGRPQAMLWSNNPGTVLVDEDSASPTFGQQFYVPVGFEIGSTLNNSEEDLGGPEFIILSDDNREPIDFDTKRIEERKRMINGRMRSYHIADKITLSTSWSSLPSRAYSDIPDFDTTSGSSPLNNNNDTQYTTDGGAGGVEILDWYNRYTGSFWVFLSYDNYVNFGRDENSYNNLAKYSQVIEVFFDKFDYSVEKRGRSNYDFWDISVTLEEA